ncbi:hypothetical protein [Deinococcus sp.]|uniref:hypothetical protein n=1 Tax=Deinococcus sp. TaxID=47478 RepID=UPI003C7AF0FF
MDIPQHPPGDPVRRFRPVPGWFIRLMTVLNVLAVLVLSAGGWLSYGFAGTFGLDSDSAYPPFDRVTYGLSGYRYWSGQQVITGPHRPLTWAVLWLLLVTLAWAWQFWRRGRAFGRGLSISAASLLLTLLACALILPGAESAHTLFLHQHGQSTLISASVTQLETLIYLPCGNGQGCGKSVAFTFVNPFVLSLLAVGLGSVLAALPSRGRPA